MKAISYGLSIKGNGHYITDTECQDSVKYAGGTINEKEYSIVAVADGHGGSQYARSKVGSQFAVDIAVRELEAFIKNNIDTLDKYDESAKGTKSLALLSPFSIIGKSESSTPPDLLSEIQVSLEKTKDKILSAWSNAVLSHFADNPIEVVFGTISKYNSISNECDKEVFVGYGEELEQELKLINNDLQSSILDDLKNNPKSLYGSTLLCAAKYQKHHFIIQIGDGDIEIVLSDKKNLRPIKKNERMVGNETDSLCQLQALQRMQSVYINCDSKMILLSTDGVANALESEDDLFHVADGLYQSLSEEPDTFQKDFPEFLRRFSEGSMDDCTICFIASGIEDETAQAFWTTEPISENDNSKIAKRPMYPDYSINNELYQLSSLSEGDAAKQEKKKLKASKIGIKAIQSCLLKSELDDIIESRMQLERLKGYTGLFLAFLETGPSFIQGKEDEVLSRQIGEYKKAIDNIVYSSPLLLLQKKAYVVTLKDGVVHTCCDDDSTSVILSMSGNKIKHEKIPKEQSDEIIKDFPSTTSFVGTCKLKHDWVLAINKFKFSLKKEIQQ